MPQIRNYRTWCKSCEDWTIHSHEQKCNRCDTMFESYNLSDIPENKLEEQRVRYSLSRINSVKSIYVTTLSMGHNFSNSKTVTVEDDAGQGKINEERKRQRQAIKDKISEISAEHEPYSKINRNDKCLCGSGKKYKQCHLLYFREYLNV